MSRNSNLNRAEILQMLSGCSSECVRIHERKMKYLYWSLCFRLFLKAVNMIDLLVFYEHIFVFNMFLCICINRTFLREHTNIFSVCMCINKRDLLYFQQDSYTYISGEMDIIIENGHGDLGSNLGRGWLYST